MMLAVIGAGASGLCAAIEYKIHRPDGRVCVLERGARAGRKLAATGNGRCNLSSADLSLKHYHGQHPDFAVPALMRYNFNDTRAFFERIGIPLRRECDKYFPYSFQASAVVDALRLECARLGIDIISQTPVSSIQKQDGVFLLTAPEKTLRAHAVVVACGGAANAPLGGTGDGYTLLSAFGHGVTPLFPSIVQLKTNPKHTRALAGVKQDALAALYIGGKKIRQERAEVLFTDYGLSGPAILQLSGLAVRALAQKKQPVIQVDLLPDLPLPALLAQLHTRTVQLGHASLEHYLIGLVQNRVGLIALKAAGLKPLSRSAASLEETEIETLAAQLKSWTFHVQDSNGMKNAQVTAGGVETAGFDADTMQSRLCPGLFACGEVLDIDGDCGGYNLQWAWSSGRLAGASAAALGV